MQAVPAVPISRARMRAALTGLGAGLALTGCAALAPSNAPIPSLRPATPATVSAPSPRSADLARYYGTIQRDLLTRGLLRTDGGGPDTPFTADDLLRNFEAIAFFDEYTPGTGIAFRGTGRGGRLSRWAGPVRIGIEFGASVPPDQRRRDQASITAYADRLARVTGQPVGIARQNANFNVFVAGEDDSAFVQRRLSELIPGIRPADLDLFRNLPRSYYCLVIAVSAPRMPNVYTRAVALIRAEHPDLVRLSCIHEEIAQGLGLPNDSPEARPSIFNDDDEFALLTAQDELLLKMLYDPRLQPGMTADEARPIARIIARELMGQPL